MVHQSVVTPDGESIQDTPEILHLHGTNDKKMDPVNSQKITSYDRKAERSLSKRKNRKEYTYYEVRLNSPVDHR